MKILHEGGGSLGTIPNALLPQQKFGYNSTIGDDTCFEEQIIQIRKYISILVSIS